MNPEEALDAFAMLDARHMIPMHYGTFPLSGEPIHEPAERLAKAMSARQLEDRVLVLPEGLPAIADQCRLIRRERVKTVEIGRLA